MLIERLSNEKIREYIDKAYYMKKSDRMLIDILLEYAFIMHEDLKDITDDEIAIARNYAESYLENKDFWKNYNSDFELFVNRQKFQFMTDNDYESIEKLIYQVVKEINDLVDIYDWDLDIYYSVDYENKLLLSRLNKDGYYEKIDLIYDFVDRSFSPCDILISDDMDKLGNINYNSYTFYELYNVRI